MKRPDSSPWNPLHSVEVTPEEYEVQVASWVRKSLGVPTNVEIVHREVVPGTGGEYEIDVVLRFRILNGAQIVVLVECKRHSNPVKRDDVLAFSTKLREVGAHKGIVFSTAGFQRGAIEFADSTGIATITFIDGKSIYETKSQSGHVGELPAWLGLPKFAGHHLMVCGSAVMSHLVDDKYLDSIKEWMAV